MCDTFYLPKQQTIYNANILAKNSDREPNEAQAIVNIKAKKNPDYKNSKLKVTYIEVPEHPHTYEVFLSKPFQMWGAEMGVNEHGVAIGNEAVFTKIPFEKKNNGLTGMDMIRLSLERKKTAKEALFYIIELIEQYGQDACGGYENKNFYYHNSCLIVDKKEAYCLESAGKFWAYKKLNSFYNISNGLTLTDNYDEIHKDAINFAEEKNWYKNNQTFNFSLAFSDRFYTYFSKCQLRREITKKISLKEKINVMDCIKTLQSHGDNKDDRLDSMESICLHSGGLRSPSETTGSMIVILRDSLITTWLTGTSHPCLSLYKPLFFGTDTLKYFKEPTAQKDESLWWLAEEVHRKLLNYFPELKIEYQNELKEIQEEFINLEQELTSQKKIHKKDLEELSEFCLDKEKKFIQKWRLELSKYNMNSLSLAIRRPLYFYYRTKLDKKVKL